MSRTLGPALGLLCAALLLAPAPAFALTNYTWTGATVNSGPTSSNWSNTTNWNSGSPSGSVGTLTFPALTNAECTAQTPTEVCYQSNNDVSGISADGLSIDDGVGYRISGSNAVTLGASGLTAAPSANDNGRPASIGFPITLGANQTWSLTGGTQNQQLAVNGNVTGSGKTLAVSFSGQTFLGFTADVEVGAVSVTGNQGVLVVGSPGTQGKLNATDGSSLSLSGGAGLFAPDAAVGPLSMSGGQIQIGETGSPSILSTNGNASLDGTSGLSLFVSSAGTTAGTDFSQLSVTGNVDLTGATLSINGGTFPQGGGAEQCASLNHGDVLDIVTATGTRTGTFSNAAEGSTITLFCNNGTEPTATIHYTSNGVQATIDQGGGPGIQTTTTLSPSPASSVTNQTVTLTATVSAASGTPDGTVTFLNNGTPISGCSGKSLTLVGSDYQATCTTSFDATSSPESLNASFTPSGTSTDNSSASTPQSYTVGKSSTSTSLGVSNASPNTGDSVTYTATVTPGHSGTTAPGGTVTFLDNGSPIGSCSAQPVSAGQATCTLSYADAGSHSITATYNGDGNFSGSSSSASAVNVQAPASTTPPPSGGGSTPPPTGGGSSTPPPTGSSSPPSPSAILSALSAVLPRAVAAKIGAILKGGGLTLNFDAPGAGKLLMQWFYVPKGAHVTAAKPVLVASGSNTFASAGAGHIKLKLTPAGRKLLKKAKRIKLTAKGTFTPAGGTATSAKKALSLRR